MITKKYYDYTKIAYPNSFEHTNISIFEMSTKTLKVK